jgi:hypothetical protein
MQAAAVAAFKIAKLLAQAVLAVVVMAQIMTQPLLQLRQTQVAVVAEVGMFQLAETAAQVVQAL